MSDSFIFVFAASLCVFVTLLNTVGVVLISRRVDVLRHRVQVATDAAYSAWYRAHQTEGEILIKYAKERTQGTEQETPV